MAPLSSLWSRAVFPSLGHFIIVTVFHVHSVVSKFSPLSENSLPGIKAKPSAVSSFLPSALVDLDGLFLLLHLPMSICGAGGIRLAALATSMSMLSVNGANEVWGGCWFQGVLSWGLHLQRVGLAHKKNWRYFFSIDIISNKIQCPCDLVIFRVALSLVQLPMQGNGSYLAPGRTRRFNS